MAKTQVEIQFTLPIDEALLHHKTDAEYKVKEAFVLELLRQGTLALAKPQNYLTFHDGIFQS